MTEHIRIRCQVLKTIAAIGPCQTTDIHKQLPHLSIKQIQKTCSRLNRQDDEIKVVEKLSDGKGGNPTNVHQVRGEEEERNKIKYNRVRPDAASKRSHRAKLQQPMRYDEKKARIIVFNRDRKIDLLTSLLEHVEGTRKDLLMGIINDYK